MVCVPNASSTAITTTNKEGKCAEGNTLSALPTYEAEGIDKKPTAVFSGVNVQIVGVPGKEETLNGEGNLIIGANPEPGEQTGSNNLVLGFRQKYTGYGDLHGGVWQFRHIAGCRFWESQCSHRESNILGGSENETTGNQSVIDGGQRNKTTAKNHGLGEENLTLPKLLLQQFLAVKATRPPKNTKPSRSS